MDFKSKYLKYKNKYLILIKKNNNLKRQKLNKIINNNQLGGASAGNNAFLDQFQKLIICPISHSIMIDPVTTSDGQTYDREHIEQWLDANTTSPLTGEELEDYDVVPNIALKNVIEHIINEGMLDMDVIREYLENLELPGNELNLKISEIIKNKIKNSGTSSFTLPQGYNQIYVTGLNLEYGFDLLKQKYVKEVLVSLSNDQVLKIIKTKGEDSTITDLGKATRIVKHVRPVTEDSLKDIIIFEIDSPEVIKDELEQILLSDDFYKIVKEDIIPKVIISPKISYNPVFYAFMNYEDCNIMNKINRLLCFQPMQDYNNFYMGLSKRIFSKKGSYKELFTAPEERVNDIVKTDIQDLNNQMQNTRYTLCGIFMEDIPYVGKEIVSLTGESWGKIVANQEEVWRLSNDKIVKKSTEYETWRIKENYIIAFTGERGIGKSYLTHASIKPEAIFETDSCTKESFLESYIQKHNPTVIVIGFKDPSFDLDFIKTHLDKPIYECKIVNISERFNHEEEERLEQQRQAEQLRQEALLEQQRQEQQRQAEQLRHRRQQGIFLIAYKLVEIPTTVYLDEGPVDGFNYVHKLYLSNNRVIYLIKTLGECGSRHTTSTNAIIRLFNYDNSELFDLERLPVPLRYFGTENYNLEDDYEHTIIELMFEFGKSIIVDENGGNSYCPSGSITLYNFP